MKKIRNILLIIGIALITVPVMAQGDIISAADFMKLYKTDNNLVIIDAGKADNYNKIHIKNAINIPHSELNKESEIPSLIKSPAALAKFLGEKGVSQKNTIVIYDEGSQKYSSRDYWILKYLGVQNVKLLHKDLDEFKKAHVPLTSVPTKRKPVAFIPKVNKSMLANMEDVKNSKAIIVDTRPAEDYYGTSEFSEGHIPHAVNISYTEVTDDNHAFKSKEKLQKLVARYGITAETPVILYCRTGIRASLVYAAFVNVLGYKNVKLYDGAYVEWYYYDNPLETKPSVSTRKSVRTGTAGGC